MAAPDVSSLRSDALHGVGIGWRPELADLLVELGPELGFTEMIAETVRPHLPTSVEVLLRHEVPVVPHGVSLGLAGAQRPDPARLKLLAEAAVQLKAPLVSEHVAFVRTTGSATALHPGVLEAGHLVPGPRTRDSLAVLVENVCEAMAALPCPLALENPARTMAWPEDTMDEAQFLGELAERTGCLLVLDLANLYVSSQACGGDPFDLVARMPLEQVAYVHVAGGAVHDGVYLDTHAHPIPPAVFDLITHLRDLTGACMPGILIERDDHIVVEEVREEWQSVRQCCALQG